MGIIYHILQPPVKRPAWLRLTVTVTSLALAFATRVLLEPWLLWHSPFALFLPAVLASAWYGGARAGLLATVLGGVGAAVVFMAPMSAALQNVSDLVAFLLFLAEGTLISGVCEVLHLAVDRAQGSAVEAARKFETMANSAPVLIWSTDASGRCVFVNRNWLQFTGRTSQQELGSGWTTHVHPDDLTAYRQAHGTATSARKTYQLEYRLRRADGTYRWLLERAEPRHDRDGRFEGFIGSCTDITASRREREELDFLARLQRNLGSSLDLERLAGVLADAAVPHVGDWFGLELVQDNDALEVLRTHQAGTDAPAPLARPAVSALVVETGQPQLTSRLELARLAGGDEALREQFERCGRTRCRRLELG